MADEIKKFFARKKKNQIKTTVVARGYNPETETFYTKKMKIEKKGKDRVDVYSDSGE